MTPESTVGPVRNGSASSRNPLIAFFIVTYLISWGLWLSQATLSLSLKDPLGGLINGLAIFGPTLAGLILTATFMVLMDCVRCLHVFSHLRSESIHTQ